MQVDVTADRTAVWQALTTHQGITSWWTTRAEAPPGPGGVLKLSFPDAPITWDLRVDRAEAPERLVWHCVGGPPQWIGTEVVFALDPARQGPGTSIRFDHVGWRDTGKPMPYLDF